MAAFISFSGLMHVIRRVSRRALLSAMLGYRFFKMPRPAVYVRRMGPEVLAVHEIEVGGVLAFNAVFALIHLSTAHFMKQIPITWRCRLDMATRFCHGYVPSGPSSYLFSTPKKYLLFTVGL